MKNFSIIFLALVGFCVIAWQFATPTYTYRYRLKVEIDTPDGVKSGSSVIEVVTRTFPRWMALGNADESVRVYGEAVYVDLGHQKGVFGLITNEFEWLAPNAFLGKQESAHMSKKKRAQYILSYGTKRVSLQKKMIPPLIYFKDTSDPESVELVYFKSEDSDIDNFAEIFGEAYKLKNVSLEITSDQKECSVLSHIPWWNLSGRPAVKVWKKINFIAPLRGIIEPERLFERNHCSK